MALAAAVTFASALLPSEINAQILGYASASQNQFASDGVMVARNDTALTDDGEASASVLPERLRRATVSFNTSEARGTIIIDTGNTVLYYVLGQGAVSLPGSCARKLGLNLVSEPGDSGRVYRISDVVLADGKAGTVENLCVNRRPSVTPAPPGESIA